MARGQDCMLQSEIHIHVDTHMYAQILTNTHKHCEESTCIWTDTEELDRSIYMSTSQLDVQISNYRPTRMEALKNDRSQFV